MARAFRRVALPCMVLLPSWIIGRLRTEGLEHLEHLTGPVIFASNHRSHADTCAILLALPHAWRYRVAASMCDSYFGGKNWVRLRNRFVYFCTVLWGNAFTLPRTLALRGTLRHTREMARAGWSILIYPEGERSRTTRLLPFESGVGWFALKLGLPIVPVHIAGTERILHPSRKVPQPGAVRLRFGAPILPTGTDRKIITRQVERAIRDMEQLMDMR